MHNYISLEDISELPLFPDPLSDPKREQLFVDPFWCYPSPTIEDWAALANPPSLPELY